MLSMIYSYFHRKGSDKIYFPNNLPRKGFKPQWENCLPVLYQEDIDPQCRQGLKMAKLASGGNSTLCQFIRVVLQCHENSFHDDEFFLCNMQARIAARDVGILSRYSEALNCSAYNSGGILLLVNPQAHTKNDRTIRSPATTEELQDMMKIAFMITCIAALIWCIIVLQVTIKLSWRKIATESFFALFLISIPWNWWHIYKVGVARRRAEALKNLSPRCENSESPSFLSVLRRAFGFTEDECAEYHEKMLVDPFYETTPTKAISKTITVFVFEPLEHIGKSVGKLIQGTLKELPVPLWPLALVFLSVMSGLVLILAFGYRIHIFHVFGIEPRDGVKIDASRRCRCRNKTEASVTEVSKGGRIE